MKSATFESGKTFSSQNIRRKRREAKGRSYSKNGWHANQRKTLHIREVGGAAAPRRGG